MRFERNESFNGRGIHYSATMRELTGRQHPFFTQIFQTVQTGTEARPESVYHFFELDQYKL